MLGAILPPLQPPCVLCCAHQGTSGISPLLICREQNSTKADLVFAEVSKTIQQYPVDFRGARILTGNEEGSFGWITINYLLETLVKVSAWAEGEGLGSDLGWLGCSFSRENGSDEEPTWQVISAQFISQTCSLLWLVPAWLQLGIFTLHGNPGLWKLAS